MIGIQEPDHYAVLQVHPRASAIVIRKAYRALMATGGHPDVGGSADRAKLLSEAFRILSDPDRRRAYDLSLLMGQPSKVAPGPASPHAPPPSAPVPRSDPLRGATLAVLFLAIGALAGAGGATLLKSNRSSEVSQQPEGGAAYHLGAGRAFLSVNSTDEAEGALHRALEVDPRYRPALVALGQINQDRGKDGVALFNYERAAAIDPADAILHFRMGQVALHSGNRKRAVFEWLACIRYAAGDRVLDARARRALKEIGYDGGTRKAGPEQRGDDTRR